MEDQLNGFSKIKILLFLGVSILLSQCEVDKNPCYGTLCKVDEYCVDGECVSASIDTSGVSAPPRLIYPTPTEIFISSFAITRFPVNNVNGQPWDPSSRPDVIVRITQGANSLYLSDTLFNTPGNISINFTNAIKVTDYEKELAINLYEVDPGRAFPEHMGGALFDIYQPDGLYPDTLSADLGGPIAADFYVSYRF